MSLERIFFHLILYIRLWNPKIWHNFIWLYICDHACYRRKCIIRILKSLICGLNTIKQRSTMFALYNKIHDCIFILFFHISSVLNALIMFIWERNPYISIVYFLHLFLEINKLITTISPLLITRLLVDCVKNEDILACPLIFLHPMASLKLNINFFTYIFFPRYLWMN